MYNGKKVIEVGKGSRVKVVADGSFVAYALEGEHVKSLLGPFNNNVWMINTVVPEWCESIEIRPKNKDTNYEVEFTRVKERHEKPDTRPMEIPLDACRPQTMEELVKKYVAVTLSAQMEDQGHETFEESNDFDIDEDDDFVSPYEIVEMIDEVPIEMQEEPPKEEKPNGNAKPTEELESPPKEDVQQPDAKQA